MLWAPFLPFPLNILLLFSGVLKGATHILNEKWRGNGASGVVAKNFKDIGASVMSEQRAEPGQWQGFVV